MVFFLAIYDVQKTWILTVSLSCPPRLRGDPYLWDELQQIFAPIPLRCSKACFIRHFEKFFHELTNHSLKSESDFWVEKYDHGGMSGGGISIEFWQKNAFIHIFRTFN
jgi:hypothetical protein